MDPITWSMSKSDTAMSCLYKYNKVYNEKIKESSDALTLGTEAHEVLATALVSRESDVASILTKLDAVPDTLPELYALVPSISEFVQMWHSLADAKGLESTVEKQYALDRNGKQVDFFSPDAYIRGVFDLYTYNEAEETLTVLDHKSNKALGSKAYVRDHNQLKLYVWMLTKMFNLKWRKARVAINFIKHGKVVHYDHDKATIEAFGKKYMKLLNILEDQITTAYETNTWPTNPGFQCGWCSFKNECGK